MGITRIEVNEYTCELCGYKWVNRINGEDRPIPKRCAKCKHQHWEKGHIGALEQRYRDAVKKRFGYFHYIGGMFHGGWQTEKNVKLYLQRRPSVVEMKVLLHPMSYLYKSTRPGSFKHGTGAVPAHDMKHVDVEATKEAHEYEKQLSRQLLKEFMTQRGIPYDENEAKVQTLWSRHGKYAIPMLRYIPELCTALREDWYPGLTDEEIRDNKQALENIKAMILKEQSKELLYLVASPEEVIESCWPEWLIAKPSN
jgi:hypothetical protein